jgi:acetylornithine/N-succinyldiaminopimelate aminotransferase
MKNDTMSVENEHGLQVCVKHPLSIERGVGARVWDENGRAYLDFTSGWGVTCLGHSHPVIVAAIQKQAGLLMQNPNSGFTYSPARSRLLALLLQVLPAGLTRMFFANSGAEANDLALKLARKVTGRSKVIALSGSFHGRTLATLSVSGDGSNAARYLPKMTDNCFVSIGDVEALTRELDDSVAAVILEPVLGEGGARPLSAAFMQELAVLCKANGSLLIVDEIQTGFCRTGKFFAVESTQISPDILTMGKGIAGGFPFAGVALTQAVANKVALGDHGGTYCGNPLGCAVAHSVVSYLIENRVAQQVSESAAYLCQRLERIMKRFPDLAFELRGQGLLIGLQLQDDNSVRELTSRCMALGLLVTPTRGGVVRLLPSLLISRQEIDEGVEILEAALSQMSAEARACAVTC